jgi:hypothetical protein
VVRRCVGSRNLKNEEAMTRVGSQRHRKKNESQKDGLINDGRFITIIMILIDYSVSSLGY